MANYGRGQSSYGRGNYGNQSYGNYSKPVNEKPPFNLEAYVEDFIDIYQVFEGKLKEREIELPPDTIARWVTSAKISMDK